MRHRVLLGLFPALCTAQTFLNLDFEIGRGGTPRVWFAGGAGYEAALDTAVVHSGKQSLRIRCTKPEARQFGVGTNTFPLEAVRGKKIRYTGWIKTEDVAEGYAGLWWRVDGPSGMLGFDNMGQRGAKGTTPWTQYAIELEVDPKVTNINFGVLIPGTGTAWFDTLQVEIDGAVYPQSPPPPPPEPTKPQLEWIRTNAVVFNTPDAGTGFRDLQPLKQLIGSARIVGLGEATHGTSEFFRMKHRLTEFLASEMGFTFFAIEANMPEAYAVNEYVLTGQGDPAQLIKGMYFWTWRTQEVLDMVLWMRKFNESGKGKIQFLGFDMQYPRVASTKVFRFLEKADPEYVSSYDRVHEQVLNFSSAMQQGPQRKPGPEFPQFLKDVDGVLAYLEANRDKYAQSQPAAQVDWAIQNARIVKQCLTAISDPVNSGRDRAMADNVEWIVKQAPAGTKIVLWAHNAHVSKHKPMMGQYLAERFGKDYVVLGFAFHEGAYTAMGAKGLATYDAVPSMPGSYEWWFHQSSLPRFVFDLRKASPASPTSAWLAQEHDFRGIGAMAMDGFAPTRTLTTDYDALISFDQTKPSVLLPK